MKPERSEIEPGLWCDARRALWLERERILAVADLHLGYAWAQRAAGQLLPLEPEDTTTDRLIQLCDDYHPRTLVVAGDIVHQAVPIEPLGGLFRDLWTALSQRSEVRLLMGNHDRRLPSLLKPWGVEAEVGAGWIHGGYGFVHGDREPLEFGVETSTSPLRWVIGHEHPMIRLGDGVATSARCPCFLISGPLVVLPAFSHWAAGTVIGRQPFLSAMARHASFDQAIAIVGDRLLPMEL